jgi:hypothetical protein
MSSIVGMSRSCDNIASLPHTTRSVCLAIPTSTSSHSAFEDCSMPYRRRYTSIAELGQTASSRSFCMVWSSRARADQLRVGDAVVSHTECCIIQCGYTRRVSYVCCSTPRNSLEQCCSLAKPHSPLTLFLGVLSWQMGCFAMPGRCYQASL